jgi:acyl-coenzyme A thioesterase PaaI-like protein
MEGGCYGCGDDNPISLGMSFTRENDVCVAMFCPRTDHRGVPGFLHGGVAATVLDETMASLGFMLDGVHCITATLDLKYRKPVPLNGEALRIESWREDKRADELVAARTETRTKRRHRVFGRLLLADGTLAIEATGVFISVPSGTMAWQA